MATLGATDAFAARFDALVRDLLDVTRIAAGRLRLDMRNVDVTSVAREVVERFSDEAARAGSTLELRDRGSLLLRGDRARIDQVLTNLIGNAVKYGAGKPIKVSIRAEGSCAEAGVAKGARTDGRELPRAEAAGAVTGAAHGVRERALPEYWRMLAAQDGYLHDAGQSVHTALGFLPNACTASSAKTRSLSRSYRLRPEKRRPELR